MTSMVLHEEAFGEESKIYEDIFGEESKIYESLGEDAEAGWAPPPTPPPRPGWTMVTCRTPDPLSPDYLSLVGSTAPVRGPAAPGRRRRSRLSTWVEAR
jgi:hypothetical protein